MLYIGIDQHSKQLTVNAIDASRQFGPAWRGFLSRLKSGPGRCILHAAGPPSPAGPPPNNGGTPYSPRLKSGLCVAVTRPPRRFRDAS